METSQSSLSVKTKRKISKDSMDTLLSLREECLANLPAALGNEKGQQTAVGFGLKSSGSQRSYVLTSAYLKTRPLFSLSKKATLSKTSSIVWGKSGMTVGGIVYAPAALERVIGEKDSFYSLPTPTARDWKDWPGMKLKSPTGRQRADQLPRRVFSILNTPAKHGFRINPLFSLWLMGYPVGLVEAALRCVGNSVVPQVIQIFAKALRTQYP